VTDIADSIRCERRRIVTRKKKTRQIGAADDSRAGAMLEMKESKGGKILRCGEGKNSLS